MRLACRIDKQYCKHEVAFARELHVSYSERGHAVSQLRLLLPVPIFDNSEQRQNVLQGVCCW